MYIRYNCLDFTYQPWSQHNNHMITAFVYFTRLVDQCAVVIQCVCGGGGGHGTNPIENDPTPHLYAVELP